MAKPNGAPLILAAETAFLVEACNVYRAVLVESGALELSYVIRSIIAQKTQNLILGIFYCTSEVPRN